MPTKTVQPLNKDLNKDIESLREKFHLFQECVQEWMIELSEDIYTLEESRKSPEERPRVIRFPGQGKS